MTRKQRELVSVRDRGKHLEVNMLNSFDSLTELGEGNSWALTFVNGSPPPLQVDGSIVVLSVLSPYGGLARMHVLNNSHD